jgi:hypothetical protein
MLAVYKLTLKDSNSNEKGYIARCPGSWETVEDFVSEMDGDILADEEIGDVIYVNGITIINPFYTPIGWKPWPIRLLSLEMDGMDSGTSHYLVDMEDRLHEEINWSKYPVYEARHAD